MLGRLAQRRGLDRATLLREAGVGAGELRSPEALRRVAAVLGWHAADVFALAGAGLPDDLAPVDRAAGSQVHALARSVLALGAEEREAVRRFAASLPDESAGRAVRQPAAYMAYPPGPGAVLIRMAWNRNLDWMATAMTVGVVTPRNWSAVSYGSVGRATTPVTSELLADFCAVLDVPADDLSAVTGVALPTASATRAPTPVAELIWIVRRLSGEQVAMVVEFATSPTG